MNRNIRVIKHTDQQPGEPEVDPSELPGSPRTGEIAGTIKLWVNEFKQRRDTEEQHSRNIYRLTLTASSLLLVLLFSSPIMR
jgi:hypothetical protein